MIKFLLVIVGLVGYGQAGILSDTLFQSFSSGAKQKNVILEFPSVLSNVLQSSSLSGLFGDERADKIVSLMQEHTRAMQAPIINSLSALGISQDKVKSFWIDNKLSIEGVELGPLQALAAIPGVFTIREEYQAKIFPVVPSEKVRRQSEGELQWGVAKINAKAVWDRGCNGQGIVVGVIDTGLNAEHEALADRYKNDAYSWKDGFGEHDTPYDGHGHGTHCAGTIAGDKNGIGVAPGAKIIACRGLDDKGSGGESSLLTCGQWMACPKNESGTCSERPHIVSNSWGGAVGGQTWFNNVIAAWQKVGIIPVFAIGNSGPACGTAGSPGDQPNLISVGSTDPTDSISSYSSRGSILGNFRPIVAAPGRDIVSASNTDNTGYVKMSGTSMATPHVAGAIALIKCAKPNYTYDDIYNALTTTAVQPKINFLNFFSYCRLSPKFPNSAYGYGRIDVDKASA